MVIAEGKVGFGEMPAWKGTLDDREIRSVIAYIKTLWVPDQQHFQEQVNQARPVPP
jgi:mono/diheme cytochrome c family protein